MSPVCSRDGAGKVRSSFGRPVTVAGTKTAATAMATRTAFTRCLSAARPKAKTSPGTPSLARPLSLPRTAAVLWEKSKS